MASTHFASAHFASVHFLSNHFSGGTAQVVVAPVDYYNIGNDGLAVAQALLEVPNGHIIAIAMGTLIIIDDDLE
jgi:hypothetical protein